jgi:hypothetical protein
VLWTADVIPVQREEAHDLEVVLLWEVENGVGRIVDEDGVGVGPADQGRSPATSSRDG